MEISKDEFQDKPHRGLRWRCYWWKEEFLARINNRKAHLARSLIRTEPYKQERKDIREQLKEANQKYNRLAIIDFTKELSAEDRALLNRSPKPIKLVIWKADKIERESELKIEQVYLKHSYWFEEINLTYPSPEWLYEKKCESVVEDFEDKQYKKYQQRLELRRKRYRRKVMNRARGIRQEKEQKGIIQFEEVSRLRRVSGQLQAVLKMVDSPGCQCLKITNQLKSVSSIARKIALHVLERHIRDCIGRKDYKELASANKAMDKLQRECQLLGIITDEEEEVLWKTLDEAEERVDSPTDG